MRNEMSIQFSSLSENESFARVTVAAFISQLDPTMDELTEIKTVVSEAVTNSIIHGYHNQPTGTITITCVLHDEEVELTVKDDGCGIGNLEEARQPLYTSKPELERSGMGFTIMENFMDVIDVTSGENQGTIIQMKKQLTTSKTVCK
ncbi:Non-specific serine/threonine protein kinase [Lentibacillus sp. JNUCC-1]|uniref:anti-sigma F factor n=1 Tax=Lentibacillus sp. JNUCC-1 TaxID=2654513 RepID=UPI0012E97850|nr:anti-sigma F factor [Lentibacillus sp. JNUCC-1]MUV39726.1 Non-specific serine/threonine protein kinase [Lentibacillus sp. JNUCC-1]